MSEHYAQYVRTASPVVACLDIHTNIKDTKGLSELLLTPILPVRMPLHEVSMMALSIALCRQRLVRTTPYLSTLTPSMC